MIYFIDPSKSSSIDDWTKQIVPMYGASFYQEDDFIRIKGQGPNATTIISYDPIDDENDVEALVKFKLEDDVGKQGILSLRYSGDSEESTHGYTLSGSFIGGKGTLAIDEGQSGYLYWGDWDYQPDTMYWARFSVQGDRLKAKVWEDGSSEPGWMLNGTDSSVTSGDYNGLHTYQRLSAIDYYYISFGTSGDPALTPGEYDDYLNNLRPELVSPGVNEQTDESPIELSFKSTSDNDADITYRVQVDTRSSFNSEGGPIVDERSDEVPSVLLDTGWSQASTNHFEFSIPSAATIEGIEFDGYWFMSDINHPGSDVRLDKDGFEPFRVSSSTYVSGPPGERFFEGGPDKLFGVEWEPSDFDSISYVVDDSSVNVAPLSMKVYYTMPSSGLGFQGSDPFTSGHTVKYRDILSSDGKYYWRVRAKVGGDWSPWSETRTLFYSENTIPEVAPSGVYGGGWGAIGYGMYGRPAFEIFDLELGSTDHSISSEDVDPLQQNYISTSDSSHDTGVDDVSLTQYHVIEVRDTLHNLESESLSLLSQYILDLEDTEHDIESDVVDELYDKIVAAAQDALHSLSSESIALIQRHSIDVKNTTHNTGSDSVDTVQLFELLVASALHETSVDILTIRSLHNLLVQNTQHEISVQGLTLSQIHDIVISAAEHSLTVDEISVMTYMLLNKPDDVVHNHITDELAVQQLHSLGIDSDQIRVESARARVMNLTKLGIAYGNYVERRAEYGSLSEIQKNLGNYIERRRQLGQLRQVQKNTGNYKEEKYETGDL